MSFVIWKVSRSRELKKPTLLDPDHFPVSLQPFFSFCFVNSLMPLARVLHNLKTGREEPFAIFVDWDYCRLSLGFSDLYKSSTRTTSQVGKETCGKIKVDSVWWKYKVQRSKCSMSFSFGSASETNVALIFFLRYLPCDNFQLSGRWATPRKP